MRDSEEIQYLQATIFRMEVEVQQIKTKQAALRRRLNKLASPSQILPPETLIEIFSYVVGDRLSLRTIRTQTYITHPVIQIISNVCSHWREITRAAPSLWKQVLINLPHSEWASLGSFNILKLHLANAKMLPISVEIRLDPLRETTNGDFEISEGYVPYLQLISLLFFQNPDRIGSATIGSYPPAGPGWYLRGLEYLPTRDSSNQLVHPNLVSLVLTNDVNPKGGSPLAHQLFEGADLPHLQYLSLHRSPKNLRIPLDNLTTLHLSGLMPKDAFDIFTRYPRLIEFHAVRWAHNAFEREILAGSPTLNPVTLNHLQTLAWDFGDLTWAGRLMESFHFPVLTRLFCFFNQMTRDYDFVLDQVLLRQTVEKQWRRFLTGLPALRYFGHPTGWFPLPMAEVLHEALGYIGTQLDELHLWESEEPEFDWWGTSLATMADIFRLLILPKEPEAPEAENTGGNSPIMRVKAVHLYENHTEGIHNTHKNTNALLKMLESRRKLTCGGERQIESIVFHVHPLSGSFDTTPGIFGIWKSWSEEHRADLDRLVEGGLEVETRGGMNPSNPNYHSESNGGHFPCPCVGGS